MNFRMHINVTKYGTIFREKEVARGSHQPEAEREAWRELLSHRLLHSMQKCPYIGHAESGRLEPLINLSGMGISWICVFQAYSATVASIG